MAPLQKCTKEQIVEAALALTGERGFEAITVRDVAKRLCVSTKPIYTVFASMDDLKKEVILAATDRYNSIITEEIRRKDSPPYKAMGLAYIRFAKEEKNLFQLLFMRDRSGEINMQDPSFAKAVRILTDQTSFDNDTATWMHVELWVCVHGIATMIATSFMEWDEMLVSTMLTDYYLGLLSKHKKVKEE